MQKRENFSTYFLLVQLVIAVLICGSAVAAQSGRRTNPPPPAPILSPEPTPTPTKSAQKEERVVAVIVGMDRYSDVSDIPLSFYGRVLDAFVERLDDSSSVKPKPVSESMSKSDAVSRARKDEAAFVVSLQLLSENTRVGFQTTRDLNDVYVEYSVFAPATGKSIVSGKVFQQTNGVLGGRPTGRTTIADNEYWLRQAAQVAAEKVIAALKVRVPRQPTALAP